jgi:hypothetical protein
MSPIFKDKPKDPAIRRFEFQSGHSKLNNQWKISILEKSNSKKS